jgi:hypothetical protein
MILSSMTQQGPVLAPHAAAADLAGGGAGEVNANVVMPGAHINISINGVAEDAIRNGINQLKQTVGDITSKALNASVSNR